MKRKRLLLVVALLILGVVCCLSLHGDVFSLWPSKTDKNDGGASSDGNSGPGNQFWNERIKVNGQEMTLTIHLLETSMPEIAKGLKNIDKSKCSVVANSNSILLEETLDDGNRLRTYYLCLKGVEPALKFQMTLPKEHLNCAVGDWPKGLPLFDGAESMTAMEFPVRNAVYGAYTLKNVTKEQALSGIDERIAAQGWSRVSREADNVFQGSGEVYMKENPQQLLILGVMEGAERGTVRVSIYSRALNMNEPGAR